MNSFTSMATPTIYIYQCFLVPALQEREEVLHQEPGGDVAVPKPKALKSKNGKGATVSTNGQTSKVAPVKKNKGKNKNKSAA